MQDDLRNVVRDAGNALEVPAPNWKTIRRKGRRRLIATVTLSAISSGLIVLGLGIGIGFLSKTPTSSSGVPPGSSATSEGHYLALASRSGSDAADQEARLYATTNLPDGTKVLIEAVGVEGETPVCCPEVHNGRVLLLNRDCRSSEGSLPGEQLRVTVTVRPTFDPSLIIGLAEPKETESEGLAQPPRVLDLLGPHFERLEGEQVTTDGGDRQIVVSRVYDCV